MRLRLGAWVTLVVALLGGQVTWLFLLRGDRLLHSDGLLIGGQVAFAAALVAMLALLRTTPPDAVKLTGRASWLAIVLGAVALQAAAVAFPLPVLSDDWVRYRVDGLAWLTGESPYATPPDAMREHFDDVDHLVPHATAYAAYPPVCQAVFVAVRWVERAVRSPPIAGDARGRSPYRSAVASGTTTHRALPWRTISATACVVATIVLLNVLRATGRSPWYAAMFAWNPLVVIESGGMGHVDAVGVAMLAGAFAAAHARRWTIAGILLALACGVKPVAGLALPVLLVHAGRGSVGRVLVGFAAVVGLLLVPFLHEPNRVGWLATMSRFGQHWEANGSIYEIVKRTLGPTDGMDQLHAKRLARRVALGAVLMTLIATAVLRASVPTTAYGVMLVFLLVSPVAYPWYLMWVIVAIPLLDRGGWAGLVWSGTAAVSYLLWRTPNWTLPAWAMAVEYVPVGVALVVDLIDAARRRRPESPARSPR